MTDNIRLLTHSSIKITGEKTIYIDPFRIADESHDADIILITHDHFDHFSPEDIAKIIKDDTVLAAPATMAEETETVGAKETIAVEPGTHFAICGIEIDAVAAYNVNKNFHPKENGWLGYIISADGRRIYIAGDTDITPENTSLNCDIAMVPVGGTYTMNAEEAAELVNILQPKIAIPTHYGSVVGTAADAETFKAAVDKDIEVRIQI